MINSEFSRALGKSMKEIRKEKNFVELEKEILQAHSINDLSEKTKKIIEKYLNN